MCTDWNTSRRVIAGDVDDAFGAQDVGALAGHQRIEPGADLLAVHRPLRLQRDGADVAVVLVIVIGVIVIVAAVLVVHVVGRVGLQEGRLERDDAREVEAAAADQLVERHVGALRRAGSAPAD